MEAKCSQAVCVESDSIKPQCLLICHTSDSQVLGSRNDYENSLALAANGNGSNLQL